MSEQPRRFLFVHLQKTAGSSLTRRIKKHFGIDAVYPNRNDGRDVPVSMIIVDHLLERWNQRRDELQVVTGHFPLCIADLLGAEFTTLTVLREPVERTLSCLRFTKKVNPIYRDLSLEKIYDDPYEFHGLLHNHMVKMFSLTAAEMTDGALTHVDFTRAHLERAKENLAAVDALGLQEHFDEFCGELTERFGWALGPPIHVNRSDPYPADERFRNQIAEDNALDVELYEFACGLYQQRRGRARDGAEPLPRGRVSQSQSESGWR